MVQTREELKKKEINRIVEELEVICNKYRDKFSEFDFNELSKNHLDLNEYYSLCEQIPKLHNELKLLTSNNTKIYSASKPNVSSVLSVKVLEFPNIHYIWIGPPAQDENSIKGHDQAGVIHMAKLNKKNKIIFWCLSEYLAHYKVVFNSYPIEVRSIENYIEQDFKNEDLNKSAKILKRIKKATLDAYNRNTKRDIISFKNVFSLFVLMLGGYILDTNVRPYWEIKAIFLPGGNHFRIPKLPEQYDCWIMYAPPNCEYAKNIFYYYFDLWKNSEKLFHKVFLGYTKDYCDIMSGFMLKAITHNNNYLPWVTQRNFFSATIDELSLIKYLYNTHKFILREKYDKNILLKHKFIEYMGKEPIKDFKPYITNIIFDYIYDEKNNTIVELSKKIKSDQEYGILFTVIYDNDLNLLEDLIHSGEDINQLANNDDVTGETLLHFAIRCKKPDCIKILIKHEARLDLKAKYKNQMEEMTAHEYARKIAPEYEFLFKQQLSPKSIR